jgi:hypothetical protein
MGHHHFYGGWGGNFGLGGFGWIFPALIVGKMIGEALEQPQRQAWPQPWPQTPPAPQPQPQPLPQTRPLTMSGAGTCANCGEAVRPEYGYCPRCGKRLAGAVCRYCGQRLDPKATECTHCGAPAPLQR